MRIVKQSAADEQKDDENVTFPKKQGCTGNQLMDISGMVIQNERLRIIMKSRWHQNKTNLTWSYSVLFRRAVIHTIKEEKKRY